MEDPFLNYFALGLLVFVVTVLFYGIIAIHDIPAQIAKKRHHPHEDAIHAAGWVSLFMLHVLWPFLWIWAMSYKPERGWGFSDKPGEPTSAANAAAEMGELKRRLSTLEAKFEDRSPPLAENQLRTGLNSPKLMVSTVEKENVITAGAAPAEREGTQP